MIHAFERLNAISRQNSCRIFSGIHIAKYALAFCIALAGFALRASDSEAEQRVVNVFNYDEYVAPEVLTLFTKETGIKINYSTYDTNEILTSILLAGKSRHDVIFPAAETLRRLIAAKAVAKLDKSKIPNWANLSPTIMQQQAQFDPNNDYAANYTWGTFGIAYNTEKIKKRLGDQQLQGWSDIFDAATMAKLKDCGVQLTDAPEEYLQGALLLLGKDGASSDPKDLDDAAAVLKRLRPSVRKIDLGTITSNLAEGNICFAMAYNGDTAKAIQTARDSKSNVDIAYVVPKEGGLLWFDTIAMAVDAPHPEEAHQFINFLLRPDVAAMNANYHRFAIANDAAKDKIEKALLNDPYVYPPEDVFKRLKAYPGWDGKAQRQVTRIWSNFRAGR